MSWVPYVAGATLTSYMAASAYFLRHPMAHLKHTPRPLLKVRASAHRGGSCERPENTMIAFEHARSLGIDLLELDVHLTKDGSVVVYHDHTVDRLSEDGINGQVRDYMHAELPHVRRNNAPLPPPFHHPERTLEWTAHPDASHAELHESFAPPLLDAVFERFPDTCINLDLKHSSAELVEKVAQLIEKHKREERTIWGSGKDPIAQEMYKRNPTIPMYTSGRQVTLIYIKYLLGWLPFSPIKECAMELPLITNKAKENLKHHGQDPDAPGFKAWLGRLAIRAYSWVSTSPPLLAHLRERNIKVIWWVLNDEAEFAQAFEQHGADGVMTDEPTKLMNYLHNTQQRHANNNGSSKGAKAE